MIQLDNLSVSIGGKTLLDKLSLHVPAGHFVAIRGESGTGKSTLLRVIIGQVKAQAGVVRVGGLELKAENLPEIRRQMVYVPQQPAALPGESGREFLEAPFQFKVNRGARPDSARITDLLLRLGLRDKMLDQEMALLSGGERQRLALVRAFLMERQALLLDEPSSAIDADNRGRVLEMLAGLPETTILAVSHDPAVIAAADESYELQSGRLVSGGE
jgi:ABC-type multidrug transport system ATPase subunit